MDFRIDICGTCTAGAGATRYNNWSLPDTTNGNRDIDTHGFDR